MASRYIGDTEFRDLLVHSIAGDARIQAAAVAADKVLQVAHHTIPDVLVMSRLAYSAGYCGADDVIPPMYRLGRLRGGLQELSEEMLDLLAWQLHVDGYELAVDVDAKRDMVWRSLQIHRKLGTKGALIDALESALQISRDIITVSEWYEYGGDPYYFRVEIDLTGMEVDETFFENLYELIYASKNVRSWLEGIKTSSTVGGTWRRAVGALHATCAQIWPGNEEPEPYAGPTVYGHVGAMLHTSTQIGPGNVDPEPYTGPTVHVHVGAMICTRTTIEFGNVAPAPYAGPTSHVQTGALVSTSTTIGVYNGR